MKKKLVSFFRHGYMELSPLSYGIISGAFGAFVFVCIALIIENGDFGHFNIVNLTP